jgi:hypothetical protein
VLPASAHLEHRVHRRAAGLLRQGAGRDPEDGDGFDRVRIHVACPDLEVGHGRVAAKPQLGVLGRVQQRERSADASVLGATQKGHAFRHIDQRITCRGVVLADRGVLLEHDPAVVPVSS